MSFAPGVARQAADVQRGRGSTPQW
jgi:hypothetical protein